MGKEKLYFHFMCLGGYVPVIVYQVGKVGSSSIATSFCMSGVRPGFFVHRMNPVIIEKVRNEYLKNSYALPNEQLGHSLYQNVVKKVGGPNLLLWYASQLLAISPPIFRILGDSRELNIIMQALTAKNCLTSLSKSTIIQYH